MRVQTLCIAALSLWLGAACAQTDKPYPTKPIRLIVPFATGGTVSNNARLFSERASRELGQPIVIENKTGAGGAIAGHFVARAPADGYTLLMVNDGPNAMLQAITKLPYHPVNDFQAITNLYSSPLVLSVPTSLKVNTVEELIALGKKRQPSLSYGTQGMGGNGHVAGSLLAQATGLPLLPVPYPGGTPMYVDLAGGRLDFAVGVYASIINFVQNGDLRVLAVLSPKRWDRLPDVPSIAEAGYPSLAEMNVWFGIAAPAGTPQPIIDKLHRAYTEAAKDTAILKSLDLGYFIPTLSKQPQEFQSFMAREAKFNLGVAKKLNLTPQ